MLCIQFRGAPDLDSLVDRLGRRRSEEKALFAEDIAAANTPTKVAFALVLSAGHQPLAVLASWFNTLASELCPGNRVFVC